MKTKVHDAYRLPANMHAKLSKANAIAKELAPSVKLGKGDIVAIALEKYFENMDAQQIARAVVEHKIQSINSAVGSPNSSARGKRGRAED